MSKDNSRNEEQVKAFITGVAEEIQTQDLDKKSGAGIFTAIEMTLAGKCGKILTASYECSVNKIPCG